MVDPADDAAIVAFAKAAALMADPFVGRSSALAAMDLDEEAWRRLEQSWRAALAQRLARGDASFAERFRLAFQQERDALRDQRRAHVSTRQERVGGTLSANGVDETAEAHVVHLEALPFEPPESKRPPLPPIDPAVRDADVAPADVAQDAADVDRTAQMTDAPWRDALPFADDDD